MNRADSARLEGYLRSWGFSPVASPEGAGLAVLNTCVVRHSAEERALSQLRSLVALKERCPELRIAVTGCLVPPQMTPLQERFPQVDLFFPAQDFPRLMAWARESHLGDGEPPLPTVSSPSAPVSVIQGCNSFCSYCIVPYRRGREMSRPIAEVVAGVAALARLGVREVVLLGQNVNAYGRDLPGHPDLAELLAAVSQVEGVRRIRFLTSHPRDITESFIHRVASLGKVCPAFSLPVQAGDDGVLAAMGRGYTAEEYRGLVGRLREAFPDAGISTDVIVGFPGEGEAQFEATRRLLADLRLDTVHIACYSPRPGTLAARALRDSVPSQEKKRRQRLLEEEQRRLALEDNARLVGSRVPVLVERVRGGRGEGRTPSGRLVHFPAPGLVPGALVEVKVTGAAPWWLEGVLARVEADAH